MVEYNWSHTFWCTVTPLNAWHSPFQCGEWVQLVVSNCRTYWKNVPLKYLDSDLTFEKTGLLMKESLYSDHAVAYSDVLALSVYRNTEFQDKKHAYHCQNQNSQVSLKVEEYTLSLEDHRHGDQMLQSPSPSLFVIRTFFGLCLFPHLWFLRVKLIY